MGNLNLFPPRNSKQPTMETAWEQIGRDFEAVGCDMWKAIEDAEKQYGNPEQQRQSSAR